MMVAIAHAAPTAPAPIIPIFMRVLVCPKGKIAASNSAIRYDAHQPMKVPASNLGRLATTNSLNNR
jgi:hypothetical protein